MHRMRSITLYCQGGNGLEFGGFVHSSTGNSFSLNTKVYLECVIQVNLQLTLYRAREVKYGWWQGQDGDT